MRESGMFIQAREMDEECRSGRMVPGTRATGRATRLMDEGD
jgi:hypothetical protein